MNSKLYAATMLLCAVPCAFAGTNVIGTVNARGDLRVDGYAVKGNATLFDGTVVQTGEAAAAIRLKSGAQVRLATNSRGTLYSDRLVLQKGSTEVEPSRPMTLQANGINIVPVAPGSKGTVSVKNDDKVEVAALSGSFRVTNSDGHVLANVESGKAYSFGAAQEQGSQLPPAATPNGPVQMSLYGTLTKVGSHYYLNLPAPDLGYVYEVNGAGLESFVGKPVVINGTVDVGMRPVGHANWVLMAQQVVEQKISNPMSTKKKVILTSLILGGAAGAAIGTYEANQSSSPASR
ncbi:MAG TPA: hypothetical protein VG844_18950 [Terracidiphilus sp.]|nr:hypothetical protein [Terracidiphilus sp.]